MKVIYLDPSALLQWLLGQSGAERVRRAVDRAEAVLARAGRAFPVEPVRMLDAIHLATALEFAAAFPDLHVLTFDRRVRDNAEALGLS